MKIELDKKDFQDRFTKVLAGLIRGNDINDFSINKESKEISFFVDDWSITLNGDGTWEVH